MLRRYPHQLSGGQQQRIALAMAFACRPSLIVLDEPTTGLDVSTQRHVLDTVRRLCRSYGVAAVYVSHDLAVVSGLVSDVAVMYAGRIIEVGPTSRLFGEPLHPYTRGLIGAVPSPDRAEVLTGIDGQQPRPGRRGGGCSFAARCGYVDGQLPLAATGAGAAERPDGAVPAGGGDPGRAGRPGRPRCRAGQPRRGHPGGPGCLGQLRRHARAVRYHARRGAGVLRGRGGRVRLRQDHARPGALPGCTPTGPGRSPSRAPRWPAARGGATRKCCGGSSTSSRIPIPPSTRGRPSARSWRSRLSSSSTCRSGSGRGASPRCWRMSRSAATTCPGTRTSCPAGSGSGSRSPAPWWPSRTC